MESPETGLAQIGHAIQRALEEETSPAEQVRLARARIVERVAAPRRATAFAWFETSRFRKPVLALSGLCFLGTAVATFILVGLRTPPISFAVGGTAAAGHLGDIVQADESERLPIQFSDGSSVLLHGGSRVRVLTTTPVGARVLLENGEAEVSVRHDQGKSADFRFEAGPFNVKVTGTAFNIAWNPSLESLSLAMQEGAVSVSAPCVVPAQVVAAGTSVRFSCAKDPPPNPSASASEANAESASAETAVDPTRPRASDELDSTAPKTPTPAQTTAAARTQAWRVALESGNWPLALREAELSGFNAICEHASLSELQKLADAARLSGQADRATDALLALRRRFPGSREAATAAFALGRVAFDQRRNYADATRWFKSYLNERPSGPLMGDAMGRLMEARLRQGDRQAARSDARRYLERFPEGPYAAEARKMLAE